MTNNLALQTINDLKNKILDQKRISSNLIKLNTIDIGALSTIRESLMLAITELKNLQEILISRNSTTMLDFEGEILSASNLIRKKEAILMKLEFEETVAAIISDDDEIIKISLEAFQNVQKYKKQNKKILTILNKYNNLNWQKDHNE